MVQQKTDEESVASVEDLGGTEASFLESDEQRDEVKEIRNLSRQDTNRIHCWRLVVTLVLLGTAVAVTLTTYDILVEKQNTIFDEAVCASAATFHHSAVLTFDLLTFCLGPSLRTTVRAVFAYGPGCCSSAAEGYARRPAGIRQPSLVFCQGSQPDLARGISSRL